MSGIDNRGERISVRQGWKATCCSMEKRVIEHRAASSVVVCNLQGGIIPARMAEREPVRTVLSGPAGGVIGDGLAHWAGFERIIGFDMGGTSTDGFLPDAAGFGAELTRESAIAGQPVSVPMLDIHSAGAGGESIAVSMRAECCALGLSRRERSLGQFALGVEPCRPLPMQTCCWDGWIRIASLAEECAAAPRQDGADSCAKRRARWLPWRNLRQAY